VVQFNFACEQSGVILYPDLVKVNVCMQRGVVSALEASSYCLNHVEREIPKAVISASQAEDKASAHAEVIAVRKAIVPVGNGKEALSYEVYAQSNGKQYFIYVDALTGKQLEVFEVIESSEGRLLI
jgi:germination protein YpeB